MKKDSCKYIVVECLDYQDEMKQTYVPLCYIYYSVIYIYMFKVFLENYGGNYGLTNMYVMINFISWPTTMWS